MNTPESQPNTQSNLQTLEADFSLTKKELEDFKKLSKEEQEKQKQDKLAKLSDLHTKLDQAIQGAIKTGELDEAKELKEQLEKEIKDLEEQVEVTKLPEGLERGIKMEVTIGGKTKDELIKEMKKTKIKISDHAIQMMNDPNFTISKKKEHLNLVKISVKDLGFADHISTDEIYEKAQKLGLELCPAEVGPQLRLKYKDQSDGNFYKIGMKPIFNSDSKRFGVFELGRSDLVDGGLVFETSEIYLEKGWFNYDTFVFVSRK